MARAPDPRPDLGLNATSRARLEETTEVWHLAAVYDLAVPPDNVHLRGTYADLGELDLGSADAWLYTSGWDGVPSQLLEVAMTGVPLVGSLVGGTGEVLHRDLSRPVEAIDDPAAYVEALREVLADPDGARDRALALRERLVHERTADRYAEAACALLLRPEGARP